MACILSLSCHRTLQYYFVLQMQFQTGHSNYMQHLAGRVTAQLRAKDLKSMLQYIPFSFMSVKSVVVYCWTTYISPYLPSLYHNNYSYNIFCKIQQGKT